MSLPAGATGAPGTTGATGATGLWRILDPGSGANRALVGVLGLLALAMSLVSLRDLLELYPRGIDLEIPLQASERWLNGGRPYLEEAFLPGSALPPFLYPPYALVLFAPLTLIARDPLQVAWLIAGVAVAVAACRRLGIAWALIPLVLLWPPFTESFVGGNVQTAIFAAFVLLLVSANTREGAVPDGAVPDGLGRPASRALGALGRGLLGAATTFLKVSQPHAVAYLVRREPIAAAVAIGAMALLAVATLPLTETDMWDDWLAQLGRASDPAWSIGGSSVAKLLPAPFDTAFLVACGVAALLVPRRLAAEWVGVLLVLGSPGLRTYYLLFLLPAMLGIRREFALVAAFCMATYTQQGWWLGIAIVVGSLTATTAHGWFRRRAGASTQGG